PLVPVAWPPPLAQGGPAILHDGYLTNSVRILKARGRNLALVEKDERLNPTRQITKALRMREYMNLLNWHLEETGGQWTTRAADRCEATVELYEECYADPPHRQHKIADDLAQEAMMRLARGGGTLRDGRVPVQLAVVVASSPSAQGVTDPEGGWWPVR